MTTKAQSITNSLQSPSKTRRYSDFDINFTIHPDTKQLFIFTEVNAVKRAMRNLILTDKYERLFRPDIGCGIRNLLFENMTDETLIVLKDTIKDTLQKYEPRVSIQEIQVLGEPDKNSVTINIAFYVLNIIQQQFMSISVDRAR